MRWKCSDGVTGRIPSFDEIEARASSCQSFGVDQPISSLVQAGIDASALLSPVETPLPAQNGDVGSSAALSWIALTMIHGGSRGRHQAAHPKSRDGTRKQGECTTCIVFMRFVYSYARTLTKQTRSGQIFRMLGLCLEAVCIQREPGARCRAAGQREALEVLLGSDCETGMPRHV